MHHIGILYLFLYKITSLLVGTSCMYMGYSLFITGIITSSSLEASRSGFVISLKDAAPGTFFALFGTIVVSFALYRGFGINYQSNDSTESKENGKESDKPLILASNSLDNIERQWYLMREEILDPEREANILDHKYTKIMNASSMIAVNISELRGAIAIISENQMKLHTISSNKFEGYGRASRTDGGDIW